MASGLAALGFDTDGVRDLVRDLVRDSETGLLAPSPSRRPLPRCSLS